VRQQSRATQLDEAAYRSGLFRVAVDPGKPARTIDDAVDQMASGQLIDELHLRLLHSLQVFDL